MILSAILLSIVLNLPSARAVQSLVTKPAAQWPIETEADRTPKIKTGGSCLLRGGTLLTVTKGRLPETDILIIKGKIAAIGKNLNAPAGVPFIDVTGKFVTPGLVDAHSHRAQEATNEYSDSIVPEVRIHDALNMRQIGVYDALASGQTTSLSLHGSANAIGGESAVIKMKYGKSIRDCMIPDAPRMVKFALGENVRSGDSGGRFPASRIGVEAVYRRAFMDGRQYQQAWNRYYSDRKQDPSVVPPRRDIRLEQLAAILDRRIWVQCHCYRADEMLMMLRLSKEFGFKLAVLQHALEAWKIMPEIKAAGVGVSTFADLWSYKIETIDAIPHNAALCSKYGILTSVNTDSFGGVHPLHLDAAKMVRYGGISEEDALKLITINPAEQLGVSRRLGSLEVGKDGDVAIWDGYPLSVYSRCRFTLIEGEVVFDRPDPYGIDKLGVTKAGLQNSVNTTGDLKLPYASIVAIVGADIHPVNGPVIPGGTLVIRQGVISAFGAKVQIPAGAALVHAEGLRLYPGLINASSTLGIDDIEEVQVTRDLGEKGRFHPDLKAITAINPATEHLPITRAAGVVAALVRPAASSGSIVGQGGVIRLDGRTTQDMTIQSSPILFVGFPEQASKLYASLDPPQKEEEAKKVRDTEAAERARLDDMFSRSKRYVQTGSSGGDIRDSAQWEALRPFVTGMGRVAFDVQTERGIRDALAFAKKHSLKPIIWGGAEAFKAADVLKEMQAPVVLAPPPGGCPGDYGLTNSYDPQETPLVAAALLAKAGIKFCFGTFDSAMAKLLSTRAGIAAACGLGTEAALKAITTDAAEILGISETVHGLDPGKRANLIITNGDPLEVTTQVIAVMIDGKSVSMDTRHTRNYEAGKRILKLAPKGE